MTDDHHPLQGRAERADLLTVAAIGVLAYVVSNVVHEGLGHGGACLAVGGRLEGISTAWLECDRSAIGPNAGRAVSAAGTVANLVVGAALFGILRSGRAGASPPGRYFMWLLMVISLLQGGGYLMVSPLFGFGDWGAFLEGYDPATTTALQVVLTAIGISISLAAVFIGRRWLAPLLPAGGQATEARRLCLIPYAAGAVVFLVAALLDPRRSLALIGLLAAHLAGTAWLAWFLPYLVKDGPAAAAAPLPRSRAFLVAGAVAALVAVALLGPSIRFAGHS
ncbi:MAG: hypothetical protein JWP97_6495 [Labilithrix sp.]|nr:hypothetical protein [Labilithrix sp.]